MNAETAERIRAVKIVLFLTVWLSCSWFGSWAMNTNNAVRVYAAVSIVEDGDATIDEFDAATIDKSRYGDHLYLDKAPGMTLMALPAVAILHAVSPVRSKTLTKSYYDPAFAEFIRNRTRLAVATGPAILTALASVLLFDLAQSLMNSAEAALVAALGYALGTPAWGWSTTLLGHAPVAALYVIALWAAVRSAERGWRGGALIVGASLGWAVVIEHEAVVAGIVIAAWTLWRWWRGAMRTRLALWAMSGGVLALLPLAAYNMLAYHTFFRLGYQGVIGFAGMDRGIFGIGVPNPTVLWNIVFSRQRGIIWYAPVALPALVGLVMMMKTADMRQIATVCLMVVAVTLLLHAGYFYWDGGNATGPRLSVPMVGMLSLGLAAIWARNSFSSVRGLILAIRGLSIAINTMIAATEIYAPPLLRFPLLDAVVRPFLNGAVRTLSGEMLGWSPSAGFILWQAIAMCAICWLIIVARQIDLTIGRCGTNSQC